MVNSASPCRFYLTDINMQRVQSSIVLLRGVDQKILQCPHSECCCLHSEGASSMHRDSLIVRRLRMRIIARRGAGAKNQDTADDGWRQGRLFEFDFVKGFGWITGTTQAQGRCQRKQQLFIHFRSRAGGWTGQ